MITYLDDLVREPGDKVEIILIQPKRALERWNKSVGFEQITVERMGALHEIMGDLTEQEAKVLWGMLNMRLRAGDRKVA